MPLPPPPTRNWIADHVVIDSWAAGRKIFRAHPHEYGSTQFDRRRTGSSRFSPLVVGKSLMPVLYGGENHHAVASETIFHGVDIAGSAIRPRAVPLDKYSTWHWSCVVPTRALRLVTLANKGLAALAVTRKDMVDAGRPTYPATQAWALAISSAAPEVDGMWWYSRQDPGRWAVVLFAKLPRRAGGLRANDLRGTGPVLPFATSDGLELLDSIGLDFGITVVR
ncbi:MAG: RES family NAD+ phosphorylase [Acidimicrobiales bacterium]